MQSSYEEHEIRWPWPSHMFDIQNFLRLQMFANILQYAGSVDMCLNREKEVNKSLRLCRQIESFVF
jgi:hypothetical protein